jgi:uncharacterized membrane protein YGL010W
MNNNTFIINAKKFNKLSNNFNEYHNNNLNIFIHLLTTPLTIFELILVINKVSKNTYISKIISFIYLISLAYYDLPFNVICLTSYTLAMLVVISEKIKTKLLYNIGLFIIGYLMQDFSHYITNEPTYQSSYINSTLNLNNIANLFIEHTYYLLPLIISSSCKYSIVYKRQTYYKIISLLPMIYFYMQNYIFNKYNIKYPWQFKEYNFGKKTFNNLYYLLPLIILSYYTKYAIFLIGTSFIHHIRYIVTYYYRNNVDYIKFKKEIISYNIISYLQLYILYLASYKNVQELLLNKYSIIFIILGNISSIYCIFLLGIDTCCLGIDLGYAEKRITKFPYNLSVNSIILLQLIILYLMNNNYIFYTNWSYLVHAHIMFYILHFIQHYLNICIKCKLPY